MHHPSVTHTLHIFERLSAEMPPLVAQQTVDDVAVALEQLRFNADLTLGELEETMIIFGKKLWPYRQAFYEYVQVHEGKLGETFFVEQLSPPLRKKYNEFLAHGGSFRDLHQKGGPHGFFSSDERFGLIEAIIEARQAVRSHARQAVLTGDKEVYLGRVYEFQDILFGIEQRLDALRSMADSEQEHPELAAEIRAQVRAFEYGLCSLGPHTRPEAVHLSQEHFVGRKKEKKHFVFA